MQPENLPVSSELYRYFAGNNGMDVGPYGIPANYEFPAIPSFSSSSFYPFEMSGITEMPQAQAQAQARALAASRNHKEAEKRRRERINSHLDKLRTLLPCTSKTDKASLLAKVIQQVKDLKQQTSEIDELELFPSETDEINVYSGEYSGDGRSILKASLCCEDRLDLLPDLIKTLKSLRLKALRAEMTTLGGRIRNVLLVTGEEDQGDESIGFLHDALKTLVERSSSNDRCKRRQILDRRTTTT